MAARPIDGAIEAVTDLIGEGTPPAPSRLIALPRLQRQIQQRPPLRVTDLVHIAQRIDMQARHPSDLPDLEADALAALSEASKTKSWYRQYSDVIPGWFDVYMGLEEVATTFRRYEAQLLPGISQTGA